MTSRDRSYDVAGSVSVRIHLFMTEPGVSSYCRAGSVSDRTHQPVGPQPQRCEGSHKSRRRAGIALERVPSATLGIYLLHPLILECSCWLHCWRPLSHPPLAYRSVSHYEHPRAAPNDLLTARPRRLSDVRHLRSVFTIRYVLNCELPMNSILDSSLERTYAQVKIADWIQYGCNRHLREETYQV